ncbi:hypothetical protein [Sorangium sp. So ce1182]|uniref:hypothetical protein n=1 Tax=Sorangium sp. So ce1182 TaxID=3133334 RepID=UPI003F608E83
MTDEPRVKGVAFRSAFVSFGKLRGEPVQKLSLDEMCEPLRDGLRYGSIVSTGWYPIAWYKDLFQAIRRTSGEGKDLIHQIGRQCTRDDMSGIYKVIAALISPTALFSLGQRVFANYYSVGRVQVLQSRRGFTRARWSGCSGFDENMWTEVIGSCEQLLEIGGASHVRQRVIAGGGEHDEHLELTAHWS